MTREFNIFTQFFLPFLYSNNAFGKFVYNCHKAGIEDLSRFIEVFSPDRWLDRAFLFKTTPEGSQFWNELSEQWDLILTTFNSDTL